MKSVTISDRQLNTKHTKASNAGFSLVELLIAVVILAIIAIPMLHMFVTSTKVNVKSRQMLRATTVAQDIMEGLKAYTLEEVRAQFAPPEGANENTYYYPSNGFYVLNTNLIQGGVREITELGPDSTGKEIYYFGIENLKMQGGEYDAFIRLDASTYGVDSKEGADNLGSTPSAGAHDNEFNGAFFAEVTGVSETSGGSSETDSSFHEDKNLNKAVLKDVKNQIEAEYAADPTLGVGALPENWDEVKLVNVGDPDASNNIVIKKRTIHVLFKDEGTKDVEGNPQCVATITFTYDCEYTYNGRTSLKTSHGHDAEAGGAVNGIRRTFSSGNFYLFYYPTYASAEVDNIEFEIESPSDVFDDEHPLLKNIVLMKQIRSNVDVGAGVIAPDMSDTDLFAKESSYKALIGLSSSGIGSIDSDKLVFRTNVPTNLSNLAKHVDPSTGEIERDDILGVHYSGLLTSGSILPLVFSDGNVSYKVTNVIYDIEITVYETGAAQYFKENNFENSHRDEVHKLATITNLN